MRFCNRTTPPDRPLKSVGNFWYRAVSLVGADFLFTVNYQGLSPGSYTLHAIVYLKSGGSKELIKPIIVQ